MPGFKGWYFKVQKDDQSLAFIPGRSEQEAFIQIIANERAWHISYPRNAYRKRGKLFLGNSMFSRHGMELHIEDEQVEVHGKLRFQDRTPLQYDIMGPFGYLPMECRHTVISMNHRLSGDLYLNGRRIPLEGGKGYIEGDMGCSFPESYAWVQCNDFMDHRDCSIMASVAEIPLFGMHFPGCIAVVHLQGREYRFATYLGGRVRSCSKACIELVQRDMRLRIEIPGRKGHQLKAPENGSMHRMIDETLSAPAHFVFWRGGNKLLDSWNQHASYEYAAKSDTWL